MWINALCKQSLIFVKCLAVYQVFVILCPFIEEFETRTFTQHQSLNIITKQ